MKIHARKLKDSEIPERTALYELRDSRDIPVEEEQKDDGSLDRVILKYEIEKDDVGYFGKEYRPEKVKKEGAKLIDITAIMLNHMKKYVRWHLYDMKDTLAGDHTVVQLYDQWNAGLGYIQKNILAYMPEYMITPDLGVITRSYDKERMKRLNEQYEKICNEIENGKQEISLSQRKRRIDIPKARAVLEASRAILDEEFRAENGDTYVIHIKQLYV